MKFQRLSHINLLLDKVEKLEGIRLLIMIILMGLFDVLGIASIMPFMTLISDPEVIEKNNYLLSIYTYFNFSNYSEFIFFSGAIVIALIIVSSLFKLVTSYLVYRFTFMREHSISVRMLKGYLNQPYEWFLNQHSSELSKSLLADVREVIARTFITSFLIISNSFTVILIVCLLIYVDPTVAITAFLFFGFIYFFLYFTVRNLLQNIGKDRLKANNERFKFANETFSLIKELKIVNKENSYLSLFSYATKNFVKKEVIMQSISSLPKYLIEMIIFASIILIILINLSEDFLVSSIIPIIALYAFAGYRLIPAIQVIFSNLSLFRSSAYVLDFVREKYSQLNFEDTFVNSGTRMKFEKEIFLENISFQYPNTDKNTLEDISLKIQANNIIGIIGATGSGKTTIIDILLGLLSPHKGVMYVDDALIDKRNVREWQKCMGYVPQEIALVDETIAANIALGVFGKSLNMESIIEAAKVANIHDFITTELKNGYHTKIGEKGIRLSGGQKQRIGIARALYNKPNVLVLDEATSALDGETEQVVMDAVNNLGRQLTIVIVAHRLSTLSKADIIYKLKDGRIHSQGSYKLMCEKQD